MTLDTINLAQNNINKPLYIGQIYNSSKKNLK